jgi:hypothetical protein
MNANSREPKAPKSWRMAIPSAPAKLPTPLAAVNLMNAASKTVMNRPRGLLSLPF